MIKISVNSKKRDLQLAEYFLKESEAKLKEKGLTKKQIENIKHNINLMKVEIKRLNKELK